MCVGVGVCGCVWEVYGVQECVCGGAWGVWVCVCFYSKSHFILCMCKGGACLSGIAHPYLSIILVTLHTNVMEGGIWRKTLIEETVL